MDDCHGNQSWESELQRLNIFVDFFKYISNNLHLAGKYAWPLTLTVRRSKHEGKLGASRNLNIHGQILEHIFKSNEAIVLLPFNCFLPCAVWEYVNNSLHLA